MGKKKRSTAALGGSRSKAACVEDSGTSGASQAVGLMEKRNHWVIVGIEAF